ncbi:MAG: 6-pyruvoyl tetrahydropterin synthase family protein [Dehalococcoidia bacterium]
MAASVTRKVTVERNRLRFAAAHMATFGGGCEPLHGHNYDVFVEVEGDLTEDSWVWDFGDLKRSTKAIIDELDHKFLLQRDSGVLEIEEQNGSWVVGFQGRRYVFPAGDVAVLPIDNSTAERIAEWVAGRLLASLRESGATSLRRITIGIEEMPGQAGWYTVEL